MQAQKTKRIEDVTHGGLQLPISSVKYRPERKSETEKWYFFAHKSENIMRLLKKAAFLKAIEAHTHTP